MFCKNRTTLIGFIGNDAETRFTSTGLSQTRFSVATNARWKDRESAEYRTRTEWHGIVWGKGSVASAASRALTARVGELPEEVRPRFRTTVQ